MKPTKEHSQLTPVIHEPLQEPWGRAVRYSDFDGNIVSLTEVT